MTRRTSLRAHRTGGSDGGWAVRRAVVVAAGLALVACPLQAQESPKPPADVADEYLRGIEAMAWRATAQRIHADALAGVRELIEIHLESDRGGALLRSLSDGSDRDAFLSLDDGSLFVAVMRALTAESPGIVNAMSARTTDVVGVVTEGDTLAHAVYRLRWDLSGSRPEMKVLTLARDDRARWRVREAPELESLGTAIRGLGRRPPPSHP